jgi:hypothetical protein
MTRSKGHRMFEGIPVVEAKKELRVFINSDDIKTAIRKDPAHCAFSNACRRLFGSHSVVFFRTVAYVELPDGKGSTRIERFALTKETKRLIIKFDRTGKASTDGYVLIPPSIGFTMDYRRKIGQEYSASGRRREVIAARTHHVKKKEPTDLRSGKGIVQFIKSEKKSLRLLLAAS